MYNSGGFGNGGVDLVVNNIFWNSTGDFFYSRPASQEQLTRNCIIKGYSGSGVDIITDNPMFVDPENGDFRLQPDSPAIDAGLTTEGVINADIWGVQRGLKGVQENRGDGSAIDIGAYEFIPRPIGVWLPNGGPESIRAGDLLEVALQFDVPQVGEALDLDLFSDETSIGDLGGFFSTTGRGTTFVTVPKDLSTADSYFINAASATFPTLTGMTPFMTILERENNVRSINWMRYR